IYHSWVPNFLPYIEQDNLAKQYDMKFPFISSPAIAPGTPNNQAAAQVVIKTLICPSTPGGGNRPISGTFSFGGAPFPMQNFAPTDSATGAGTNGGSIPFFGSPTGTSDAALISSMAFQFRGAGLPLVKFPPSEPNTIVSITDGTSNTILLCE